MAAPLRGLSSSGLTNLTANLPALALAALVLLPIVWSLVSALAQSLDWAAWQALWADPQSLPAWRMTVWTGLVSTALTWLTVASLLASGFIRKQLTRGMQWLPALLATPHAAMAIGLVLWLSPSGWALRLVSPSLTGFTSPPAWVTTQDAWGLGLILALWLKEVPFLLWIACAHLLREDVRRRTLAESTVAQTLGYTPAQAFTQVLWPQLAPRLGWPALAVLAYGLTVVDMAIIIGPTTPPTLALLAWGWLNDADLATQAQGAAAALLLTVTVGAAAALLGLRKMVLRVWVQFTGSLVLRAQKTPVNAAGMFLAVYAAVWWALAVGSVSGAWAFPNLFPSLWTLQAWHSVADSAATLWTSLALAAVSASASVLWVVAWLELAPRTWHTALRPAYLLLMVLPAVLWVVGLYGAALHWRIEGQWLGLIIAHSLMVLPFCLLSLAPAYLAVDARQAAVAASLGHSRWAYLCRIKWPLLKAAMCGAWAVGFAVSVAQYLPTLYVGLGRFATVTTEAVNLASGGQRNVMSAYAALQMLLPVAVFAGAAWLGRARRF